MPGQVPPDPASLQAHSDKPCRAATRTNTRPNRPCPVRHTGPNLHTSRPTLTTRPTMPHPQLTDPTRQALTGPRHAMTNQPAPHRHATFVLIHSCRIMTTRLLLSWHSNPRRLAMPLSRRVLSRHISATEQVKPRAGLAPTTGLVLLLPVTPRPASATCPDVTQLVLTTSCRHDLPSRAVPQTGPALPDRLSLSRLAQVISRPSHNKPVRQANPDPHLPRRISPLRLFLSSSDTRLNTPTRRAQAVLVVHTPQLVRTTKNPRGVGPRGFFYEVVTQAGCCQPAGVRARGGAREDPCHDERCSASTSYPGPQILCSSDHRRTRTCLCHGP